MSKFTLYFNSNRNPLRESKIDQAASVLKGASTETEEALVAAEIDITNAISSAEIISDLARAVTNHVKAQLNNDGHKYSPDLIANHANMLVNRLIDSALNGSVNASCSGNLDDLWQAVDILGKEVGYNLHATGTFQDADGIKPLVYTPVTQ